MRAIELKLGNYITSNGILCRVISIDINGVITEPVKFRGERFTANIDPIPLTEEWLVKFGITELHKTKGGTTIYWKGERQRINYSNGYFYYKVYNGTKLIKHVHELQNLYFALTGEELEFKQTL